LPHALSVTAEDKTVLERAMEALGDKYPKQATQTKLASIAGVKQPSVNEWRGGYPTMETAVRLATSLGICVEWLLTGRGPKHPVDTQDGTLTLLLSQLNDRQKARLARLAEVLKDD
jgi:DNA-binding XRE family transcriptional regulator